MPRKLFRKYLPSHQAIVSNPWIAKFGGLLTHHNLWHLNRRSVAGGFAAGLFAGLIPGPLQIIGGTIVAIVFRVNLPVAALTTFYTNPITIVPLYLVAYGIGELLVGNSGAAVVAPPTFSFDLGLRAWMGQLVDWTASLGKPLLTASRCWRCVSRPSATSSCAAAGACTSRPHGAAARAAASAPRPPHEEPRLLAAGPARTG